MVPLLASSALSPMKYTCRNCLLAGLREQGSNPVIHLALHFECKHAVSLDFPLLTPETGHMKGSVVLFDVVEEMLRL
jgi:hypothetical protein